MSTVDGVVGERGAVYGHPFEDFSKVVGMANALWGRGPKTPEEHALYMIMVKLSRLERTPDHADSILDIMGYARTYEMCVEHREKLKDAGWDSYFLSNPGAACGEK